MNLTKAQNKTEFTISVLILILLTCIAIGVFIIQSDYDLRKFGIINKIDNPGNDSQSILKTIDMNSFSPAGFKLLLERESYNAKNLHEKINGKAPLYLESGFKKMTCQKFVNKRNQKLWLELFIFDMGKVKNAFSVYSLQKRADAVSLPAYKIAYKTSNALFFIKGRHYIEIIGASDSKRLLRAILDVGRKTLSALPAGSGKIDEFSLFDRKYLIGGSEKLYLKSAFGFDKFTGVFTAKYRFMGKETTVFFSNRRNQSESESIASGYFKFLIENGGENEEVSGKYSNMKIVNFAGSFEIIFTYKNYIVGVHEAENIQVARKLAELLLEYTKQSVIIKK